MMKTIVVLSALAAIASASLVGIAPNAATGRFDFVNVNPTTGASSASTKSVGTAPTGSLALDNVRLGQKNWVWSLQIRGNNGQNSQAVIAREDLRFGGRREECYINTVKPVNLFADAKANSVVATTVSTSGSFGIHRFTFVADNRYCTTTELLNAVPSTNSISALGSAQFGSTIFFLAEANSGFSTSSGTQIRSYTIGDTSATQANNVLNMPGIFVQSIGATNTSDVIVQGVDRTGSTPTLNSYSANLATGVISSARSIPTTSEESSFAGAYIAKSSTWVQTKLRTSGTTVTQNVAATDFSTAATITGEALRGTATSDKVFNIFDFVARESAVDVASTTQVNSVVVTGDGFFASSSTTTSVSRCKFSNQDTVEVIAVGSTTLEGVSCQFSSASLAAGTVVTVMVATDGVNYANGVTFRYRGAAADVASIKFDKKSYILPDGVAFPSNRMPINVELFDASGAKILFSDSAINVALSGSSSDTSFKAVSGTSASSTTGRVSFPNFIIDSFSTSAADSMGTIQLVATANSVSTTASAKTRVVSITDGTVGGLSLSSATLSYSLVNPTTSTSTSLGNRALTTGSAVALGAFAIDTVNSVYNTVEIDSTGNALLNGLPMRSTASTTGVGICILPFTSGNNDVPFKLSFEKVNTDGSVDFLAVVELIGKTGADFKIVRITRAANSASTATCTSADVTDITNFEISLNDVEFLSRGRIAIIEKDSSTTFQSWLSVLVLPTTTTAASFQIRNKALPFGVNAVTQSGDDELAISGFFANGAAAGVWTVDLSDDASAINAPSATNTFQFVAANSQAYFLSAGSASAPADARLRTSVSNSAAGSQSADTITLTRGATTAVAARSASVTDNTLINLFNIIDPAVKTLSATTATVGSSPTISATVDNLISSANVKCRFTAAATGRTSVADVTGTTTATFPNAGTAVSCGAVPSDITSTNGAVFVQISNDGGENFGPEGCIAVGSGTCPAILGVSTPTGTTAPTGTTGATPISGTPTSQQRAYFFAGKTVGDCSSIQAALLAAFNTLNLSAAPTMTCSFVNNFIVNAAALRALQTGQSGIVVVSAFANAADTATATTAESSTGAVGQALATNGGVATGFATATATEEDDDDLTDGEIAGIVIGSVLGFFLIVGLIAFALKGKSAPASSSAPAPVAYGARDITSVDSTSGSYDSDSGSYDDDYDSYDSYDDDEDYSDYV